MKVHVPWSIGLKVAFFEGQKRKERELQSLLTSKRSFPRLQEIFPKRVFLSFNWGFCKLKPNQILTAVAYCIFVEPARKSKRKLLFFLSFELSGEGVMRDSLAYKCKASYFMPVGDRKNLRQSS